MNEKPKQLTPNETNQLAGRIRDILATDHGALVVLGETEEGRTICFAKGRGTDILTLLAIGINEFAEQAGVPVEEIADIVMGAVLSVAEKTGGKQGRAS